jgi:taurine---2-oxoglutarate transaminase
MHPATKSPALIPTTTRPLPLAVAAKGARIFDESGLDYIDASSGPLAVSLGHGHPKLGEALRDQFASVDYVHRTQFRNGAAERLADLVTARLGGGLDHVLFVGSGSEANEIAMKLAHLYWAAQGADGKHRFASSSLSYHGNTVGALGASGQPRYAAPYRPLVQPGQRITAPQVYRLEIPAGSTAEAECTARLRDDFARLDTAATAAILLEGIGGASTGVLVPPPGYLEELRRLCDANDVLWICDEVMSGFGRTGEWFAVDHWSVVPDLMTMAKGLTSAYVQLGAVGMRRGIADQFRDRVFYGGLTYNSHPLACAAALATIQVYEDDRLIENARTMGVVMTQLLADLQRRHRSVGAVRSIGLFGIVELVRDRLTREPLAPFNGFSAEMAALGAFFRQEGLYTVVRWNSFYTNPPLCINEAELREGFAIIDRALEITDRVVT